MAEASEVRVFGNEFGENRVAKPCPARKPRGKATCKDQPDPLHNAVIDRIIEARDVYRQLPGAGLTAVESDREFERPGPAEISRAHDVATAWPSLLKTEDHRRLFKWFFVGLSWRSASKRDPHRRSHQGLRVAFLAMIAHLTQQLVEKTSRSREILLTDILKKPLF